MIDDLLKPLAGLHIGFGSGKIVDHLGNESLQTDVIVYDKRTMPPLVFGTAGAKGLYPVEACIYAIEVKSEATEREFADAAAKAVSVDELTYVPQLRVAGAPRQRVINTLFAFKSNMTSDAQNERDRWIASTRSSLAPIAMGAVGSDTIQVPAVRVVCIADRGYGYYDVQQASFGWRDASGDHDEILWFMAGFANTLATVSTRVAPYGHYFLPGTPPPDQPFGKESHDQFREIILDLGRRAGRFDANDAGAYLLERLRSVRGIEEPIINITDMMEVIDVMEASGELRRVAEEPRTWEYVAE